MGKSTFKNRIEQAPKPLFIDQEMKDLFEDCEAQPVELSAILAKYETGAGYENLNGMLAEVQSIGFTFDWGMDGDPYGLRPIEIPLNRIEGFED